MSAIRLVGGTVYDPANGVDGEVRDLYLVDGRIADTCPPDARRLDVSGMVVMPGGVDIHSHVVGGGVNAARRVLPEEHASDQIGRAHV